MSVADVIPLPGSLGAPVRQLRRHGRLPKQIGSIPRLRALKQMQALAEREAAEKQQAADRADVRLVLDGLARRVDRGLFDGMLVLCRHVDGSEHWLTVGSYRTDYHEAAAAAQRLTDALREG
jgi:hypothetical protein